MSRAAQAKEFPTSVEKAVPEMFERQKGVSLEQLPEEFRDMFVKSQQEQLNQRFGPKY